MHLHFPNLILVPNTFVALDTSGNHNGNNTSLLVQSIEDEFPFVPLEPVARKYWNDSVGM
jgi:DNA mismatch repair protein MSH4